MTSLAPLFDASFAVQFHVYTVVPAAVIGGIMLLRRKGTPTHRVLGRIWVLLMVATAISSFFIHEINLWNGFSPIHVLSIASLAACVVIVWSARAGNLRAHRSAVRGLYFGGIGIAGLFTFAPGRIMHALVFGEGGAVAAPDWIWTVFASGLGVALVGLFLRRRAMRKAV